MKKNLFSMALGILALSACTSSDIIDEGIQSNAIGFENVVNKQTRAEGPVSTLDKNNFNMFYVFGYYTKPGMENSAIQIFNSEEVKLDKSSGNWTYSNPRYWNPGGTYYFYAYSCGDLKLNSTFGTFAMDITETKTEDRALMINNYLCDYRHQHDLVYAENEGIVGKPKPESGTATANPKVKFKFNHLLSKINAQFTSTFPAGYKIRISNVSVTNIRNYANYNPKATVKWYGQELRVLEDSRNPYINLYVPTGNGTGTDPQDDTLPLNTTEFGKPAVTTEVGFVIPFDYSKSTGGNVTLTFDIDVVRDGAVVLQRNLRGNFNPNWQAGFGYTYNVEITGTDASLEAIAFETETDPITGWSDTNGGKITLETYTDANSTSETDD